MARTALFVALAIASFTAAAGAQEQPASDPPEAAESEASEPGEPWCAAELETLSDGMCLFTPERESTPSTLVIFLHGLIKLHTTWQWSQERAIARAGKRNGVFVLMPRGRNDIASKAWIGHWTWPTAATSKRLVEGELIEQWLSAKRAVEARRTAPFDKVLVFGFSNGAYYAASLALRSRFAVDGYAVFAGGSAPNYLARHPPARKQQKPIYVGYGLEDRAHRDPRELARALRAAGWKHRAVARARVGHTMTDAQLDDALAFLRNSNR